MSQSSKEKKFDDVFEAVLAILNSHAGLAGVNHSAISRISGVSRPWIYKYVGKTKEELIQKTADHYIKELFRNRKGESMGSMENLKSVIREDTLHFLQQAQRHPRLIPLIFVYFESLGPIGKIVRETFNYHSGKLAKEIERTMKVSKADAEMLAELYSVMRLGLAFFLVRGGKTKVKGVLNIEDLRRVYGQFKDLL
jgi:hypothetical protein